MDRGARARFRPEEAPSAGMKPSALRQLSQLQKLHLGECDIGAEGAEALGEALADMSSLQKLWITLKNLNGKAQHSFKTRIPSKVRQLNGLLGFGF